MQHSDVYLETLKHSIHTQERYFIFRYCSYTFTLFSYFSCDIRRICMTTCFCCFFSFVVKIFMLELRIFLLTSQQFLINYFVVQSIYHANSLFFKHFSLLSISLVIARFHKLFCHVFFSKY